MLTTHYRPGTPNWLDIGTPDVEAAAAFYNALFGWEFSSAGPDAGGYGFFTLDGKTVGAIGPLTEEGARSAWTIYFHTTDADATAETVEQTGGEVRFAPLEIFDQGRMAGFTDPTGAQFAVWEPGAHKGLATVTDPNSLCWTELHTKDPSAAKPFYQSVFGWTVEDMPTEGFTYTVAYSVGGDEDSSLGGIMEISEEMLQGGVTPHWQPYFEVTDCDAIANKALKQGGAVLWPPADLEGVGRMAALSDPFGANFSVITSAPSA